MALALVIVSSACHKTWRGKAVQPNPLVRPTETLRNSESIVIVTGDKDLYAPRAPRGAGVVEPMTIRRYPLRNVASFTVVTRDRLRVHIQLEHKWQEYVDVRNWRGYLVDDRGRVYEPVDIDRSRNRHVVEMWDYEARSPVRNQFGDVVALRNDGYKDRRPLGSLSVFRGTADFVFYSKDIFTADVRSLTFVIERRGMRFSFTWNFAEEGEPGAVPPAPGSVATR